MLSAEMHLANARQNKIDDTDDDIPSTSGRQFTDAASKSSSLNVLKVEPIMMVYQCICLCTS